MKKTKILITVEGGIVQSVVSSSEDVEIVIVDYDLKGDEPVIISDKLEPDSIQENMYELFTDSTDSVELEVRHALKRLKF